MPSKTWFENFLNSVADAGRELAARWIEPGSARDVTALARALLSGHGEASGTALSRELCRAYEGMDEDARLAFFETLARDFALDVAAVRVAADRYLDSNEVGDLLALNRVVEAPRQELFRRMNMAPGGTATLVAMRARLLELLALRPHLRPVDADLKHLLASWFNPGFLTLARISWQSPAAVLETLIHNDQVHEVRGWDDLRRRLENDRRCFAFLHPALPDEPLIFLEVALVKGMTGEAPALLDLDAPVVDAAGADTAIFYSINNTQPGLRGLAFGNFLIKQVLEELSEELPALKTFATLSPMPGFGAAIRSALTGRHPEITTARLRALLAPFAKSLAEAAGVDDPLEALAALLDGDFLARREVLAEPLARLALAYLALLAPHGESFDPVAAFHLSNGARVERINTFADTSPHRMRASFGTMVNYRYEPESVIANHEQFVTDGRVAVARPLTRALDSAAEVWRTAQDGES